MAYVDTCLDSRQLSFYETIYLKLNGFGWVQEKSETKRMLLGYMSKESCGI